MDLLSDLYGAATKSKYSIDDAIRDEGLIGKLADVARSIYQQESGSGKNTRTSNAGAVGGMQIIPATFNRVADKGWSIENPEHNLRAGLRYIKLLEPMASGKPELIAAGYYGGEGAIPLAQQGKALRDPKNPGAPDTLQYGKQVVSRIPQAEAPSPKSDLLSDLYGDKASVAPKERDIPATANPVIARQGEKRRFGVNVDMRGENDPTRGGGTLKFGLPFAPDLGSLDTRIPLSEGLTNFLAGAGRGQYLMGQGTKQMVGMGPTPAEIDEQTKRDEPLLKTKAGVAGGVIGSAVTTAPLMFVPGINTVAGGALSGAAIGAMQPVGTDESRLQNAGTSALIGGSVPAIANIASRVISPNVNPQVRLLMEEGVTPTPGQIIGGPAKVLEQKLTSVPILGDAIRYSQTAALNDMNRAVYNRALAPIGEKSTAAVGREGVAEVSEKLGDAYNKLLPKLSFQADPQFRADLTQIVQMANQLPPQQAQRFNNVLSTQVAGKLTPQGNASGVTLKEIESDLSRIERGYRSDPAFDNRQLGAAIGEVRNAMRDSLVRANPAQAAELQQINLGYAQYARLRDAAGRQGAENGLFTPAQFSSAVRAGDRSVGHGDYARGGAFMQDFSDPARAVLGQAYPDSGTAGRLLAGGGALATGALHPGIPAGLMAASVPWLPGGRQVSAALLARRPAFAAPLADAIRNTGITRISPLLAQSAQYATPIGGLLGYANEQ
jgi:hypothetical protein